MPDWTPERLVEIAERPGVQAGVAEMFGPIEMIDIAHGYTDCTECGASLIMATNRMNTNTLVHYLFHRPSVNSEIEQEATDG